MQAKNVPRKNIGFTIIEIMIIIMILVLLIAILIAISFHFKGKESKAAIQERQDILRIENAMRFYRLDNSFYPSNDQGIAALTKKPLIEPIPQHWVKYLNEIPKDPWGLPYHYSNPGRFKPIEIYSCGHNGEQNFWVRFKYWLTSNPKINCKN
ncbi:type II secretion system major pseudopilin GspG [Legionella israelensis]|nr:type II secretion system major pseudopilin GspG [Legionella israelensis]